MLTLSLFSFELLVLSFAAAVSSLLHLERSPTSIRRWILNQTFVTAMQTYLIYLQSVRILQDATIFPEYNSYSQYWNCLSCDMVKALSWTNFYWLSFPKIEDGYLMEENTLILSQYWQNFRLLQTPIWDCWWVLPAWLKILWSIFPSASQAFFDIFAWQQPKKCGKFSPSQFLLPPLTRESLRMPVVAGCPMVSFAVEWSMRTLNCWCRLKYIVKLSASFSWTWNVTLIYNYICHHPKAKKQIDSLWCVHNRNTWKKRIWFVC